MVFIYLFVVIYSFIQNKEFYNFPSFQAVFVRNTSYHERFSNVINIGSLPVITQPIVLLLLLLLLLFAAVAATAAAAVAVVVLIIVHRNISIFITTPITIYWHSQDSQNPILFGTPFARNLCKGKGCMPAKCVRVLGCISVKYVKGIAWYTGVSWAATNVRLCGCGCEVCAIEVCNDVGI